VQRHLMIIASLVSMNFCIASIAIWHRSNHTSDELRFGWNNTSFRVVSGKSRIGILLGNEQSKSAIFFSRRFEPAEMSELDHSPEFFYGWTYKFLGLQVSHQAMAGIESTWLAIPYWLLALIFSILPLHLVVFRQNQLRRSRQHRCIMCGYDLRASSVRCPECGHLMSLMAASRSE